MYLIVAELAEVFAAFQLLAECGHRGGEAQVIRCRAGRLDVAFWQRPFEQLAAVRARCLVAQAQQCQLVGLAARGRFRLGITQRLQVTLAAHQRDFVQGGHGVTGTDFTGIDLVVAEILAFQRAVFKADLAIFGHHRRVEFELDFHVFRHHCQRRRHFVHQHFLRFVQIVDIRVIAITGIGDLLQQLVVVVAGAEAEAGQRHTAFALLFDQAFQLLEIADADIEIAVGRQQDAVDALFDIRLLRHLVRQLDAGRPGGGAARRQLIDRGADFRLFAAGGRLQHDARAAGVSHQRYLVLRPQLIDQQLEAGFQQRQLVRHFHRAGYIDQEHQIGRRQHRLVDIAGLDTDAQQPGIRIPRRRRDFGGHAERHQLAIGAALRQSVLVGEIIDQLLHPHRIGRRQPPFVQEPPHIGVGTGIDIDAERRHRLLGRQLHRMLLQVLVFLAVGGRRWRQPHRLGQHRTRRHQLVRHAPRQRAHRQRRRHHRRLRRHFTCLIGHLGRHGGFRLDRRRRLFDFRVAARQQAEGAGNQQQGTVQ